MNDRIIRVGIDGTVTYHNWPEGTHDQQNKFLRELIGPNCDLYERVMPKHLYEDWGITNSFDAENPGKLVSMLIDEEGLLKHLPLNIMASQLYGMTEHGQPIVGSVLFVGEKWTPDRIEFCPIEEMTFRYLFKKLEGECKKVKELLKCMR